MKIRIRGGTPKHGQPALCMTCRYATVIQGGSLRDQIVECGRLSGGDSRITFPVASCSGYSDRRHPSLREMEEVAWVLRTDATKKRIGFVHARDLKPDERYMLVDDDWLP